MLELRDYQRESLDALYAYWQDGGGNALIELATGTGKSLVAAKLVQELLAGWPGLRIGSITHVKELIVQNCQELIRLWPGAPVGVYSAGVGRRDRNAQILFGGIQSIWNKNVGDFDVLMIDEAHLIPRDANTMYGKFIARCLERVPDMRIVGLTATPYRLDSGRLDRGDGALFDKIVYSYGIADGVRDKYLSPLVSPLMPVELSTKGVHVRGDFVPSEIEGAALDGDYVARTAAEIVARGRDRAGWLVFCAGVAHCHAMRDEINRLGPPAAVVTGETENGERDRLIRAFKARHLQCLLSVGVLTTGFNAPHVDLVALCRPTLSTGLYVQQLGRGTRKAPGKTDCLVLDFAGNIRRHGPVDAIEIRARREPEAAEEKVKPDDVRAKVCPACELLVAVQVRTCPHCNYEWVRIEGPKHDDRPETEAPVMSSTLPPEWQEVMTMDAGKHSKGGKTPSMKVTYMCGLKVHSEWVCFEHTGFPRQKAVQWWRQMGGDLPVPASADEGIKRFDEVRTPSHILVKPGKFTEITGRKFERMSAEALAELDAIPF
jgi:DNA repair protein RadD